MTTLELRRFYTTREAAEILGYKRPRTLSDMVLKNEGPKCIRVNARKILFSGNDLATWLAARRG